MLDILIFYLLGINAACFLTFGWDKRMAINGGWRVREQTLMFLAFLGGSVGAKAGQRLFRHKTSKEPFRTELNVIILFQLFVGALLLVPPIRIFVWDFVDTVTEIMLTSSP